eukprot:14979433-Alexandrium_andersonii.AAC.1
MPPRREAGHEVLWHPTGPGAQEPAPEPGLDRAGPSAAAGGPPPERWAPHLAGLVGHCVRAG